MSQEWSTPTTVYLFSQLKFCRLNRLAYITIYFYTHDVRFASQRTSVDQNGFRCRNSCDRIRNALCRQSWRDDTFEITKRLWYDVCDRERMRLVHVDCRTEVADSKRCSVVIVLLTNTFGCRQNLNCQFAKWYSANSHYTLSYLLFNGSIVRTQTGTNY